MIIPRDYQEESLDRIWEYYQKGNTGNPVIAYPTGTGKSLIPAVFIERIMKIWPDQRFLLATHVKELIEQNFEVLKMAWPNAPAGIYSAGLKKKQPFYPIVFGGIQSMIKNVHQFGHRDIAFVDEAHLVSQEEGSMYLTFFEMLRLINPKLKIIGLTATPYRMGQGYITDDGLFTDIIHDLTSMENFNKLVAERWLAPLIPKRTHTELDISNVGMQKGEFIAGQLEHAVDQEKVTYAGLKEMVEYGSNRKSWLIFASGISHAEHIASMLCSFGIDCAAVHSKQKSEYNDNAIKHFKSNNLRAIVNYSKLTTGFNHPSIDLIGDFRPTMSIPLHVQKLGRGTRPALNKQNCLVLDFSRNVPRLGPINDPAIPRKKGEASGDIPVKICDSCGTYNHIKVRFCVECGEEFDFKIKIFKSSSTDEIIRSDLPVIEIFPIDRIEYNKGKKDGKPPYIKVSYYSGLRMFNQHVFPEHGGYPSKLFRDWWRQRHTSEPPTKVDDALGTIKDLRKPRQMRIWVNKKNPEILSVEF